MRYRIICIILCVSVWIGCFSACTNISRQEEQRTIRIGVALYDQYDTFIGEWMSYFTAEAQAMEAEQDVTITIIRASADSSQLIQNNQVEEFIEAGCDVLCVNLVDRTDVATIIDKVQAADIPCIFFNRELVEEDLARGENLYYVGADAAESAKLQGQLIIKHCTEDMEGIDKNGDGVLQYVMLEGEAGHQDAIVRTEYSVAEVADAGFKLERLDGDIANWVRSQANTKMSGWIEVYGSEIEVVFANNDDMALGAIDALKSAEIPSSQWPVIVGIDGTAAGLEAVTAGEMYGTVYNDGKGQASATLELAFALATDGVLPEMKDGKYIRLPYQIITQENVISFTNKT